ncbi:MAG: TolC family protein [Gammaproteobacteria bacterium]|nr:TolC family protein [Gammaproteobacteria bacterium]
MNRLLQVAANGLLALYAGSLSAQGLSLADAITLASRDSPALIASAEQVEATRQAAVPAGALPDPKLLMGIDNLPVDGPEQYSFSRDFMTMQRIGVMQEFTNRAKREARLAGAQSRIAVAEAQSRLTRLLVIRQTVIAWVARSTAEKQLAQIESLVDENRLLDAAVRARLSSGQNMATDAVAARLEAAMIEERRDELRARRDQAIAALRRWIGGPAAELPLSGAAPDWAIDREVLQHRLQHHPDFTLIDARGRVLDAEVAEARAAKRPDWSLEMAYQRRGPQFSNMVSLQVSVDLPVFAGSRQDPQIAARWAERRALDADREAEVREHAQMLESDLTEYHRLLNAVDRQRNMILPLAEEKVALALADWRAGKISVMDVINARRERINAGLKLTALEGERLQVAANLHYTYDEHAGEQP